MADPFRLTMFLIRQAIESDSDMLLKLAKTSHFINLPPVKDLIEQKIARSTRTFRDLAATPRPRERQPADPFGGPLFMFCIVDTDTGHCLGTSMVIPRMGGPGEPNVTWKLSKREAFSKALHIGTSSTVIELHLDETGPTEVGGLILSPAYRRHQGRAGKQIALCRYHFIGLHRALFADRLLAELMAPIGPDNSSPFWEYVGRRFINLTYEEAYRFSQRSRDFMTELLPREPIYTALLPPEARRVIGAVGEDTVPARRLLESLGFADNGQIDPFDGGPHLDVATDDVPLVRDTLRLTYQGPAPASRAKAAGFVSFLHEDGRFRCVHTAYQKTAKHIRLPARAAKLLEITTGDTLGVTPFAIDRAPTPVRPARKPATRTRASRASGKPE